MKDEDKPGIRELIVGALSGANQTERINIAPIDRARALANTRQELAIAIKHLAAHATDGNMARVVFLADVELMAGWNGKWAKALNSMDRLILCYMAVEEWQKPVCKTCNGRKMVRVPDKPTITCGPCSGSGLRRYTDESRAERYGRPLLAVEQRWMTAVAGIIAGHEVIGDEGVKDRLYRDWSGMVATAGM